ncbi:MAG: hypothetical protein K9M57_07585 [Phycisphaerae bacterium]|nr:hypothetical protein [Phycisphaerae bacterium]
MGSIIDHLDGFGNKLTVYAAANPDERPANGDKLTTRAAGFGVVRFNKVSREITMHCWPRNVDITNPASKPYPGWPKTISQEENYGRKAIAWLPKLEISGQNDPVVQIIDESNGDVVYTLRIKGTTFLPKVFMKGTYTIKVGEGTDQTVLAGIKAVSLKNAEKMPLKVTLTPAS